MNHSPLPEFTIQETSDGEYWIGQPGTIVGALTHFGKFGTELVRRANTLPKLEERNAELVEALRVCRAALGPFIEDDNPHPLALEAHTRADALLAKEAANG